jgi:hypothetical protein
MDGLNKTAFPIDFIHAVRIVLENTKISRLIDLKISDGPSSNPNTTNLGLLSMLESDLTKFADSMRTEETKLGNLAKFWLLMARLNICSFGLNQATQLRTSEAIQLRLSTFNCTTKLIQLFVATPLLSAQSDASVAVPSLPIQSYYPRAYWKGLAYASLALLKLNLTKSLPELETTQSEAAIRQAFHLYKACSVAEGDELDVAAKIIRTLGKEATQETIKPSCTVKSRMGASPMYEMIMSALVWRKQRALEQREESRNQPEKNNSIEHASRMDNTSDAPSTSPQELDKLIASSGCLMDDLGPVGLYADFWDTSMFDHVSTAVDTLLYMF